MSLLHKIKICLPKIDPLGDGLREEIEAEQTEPNHISLDERQDGDALAEEWSTIVQNLEADPHWSNIDDE